MWNIRNLWKWGLAAALTVASWPTVAAGGEQPDELSIDEALAMDLEELMTVSIATGTPRALDQAPAIATVVTAEDIRAMGASDLEQVLESVPGLHVSRNHLGYDPLFVMRGLWSEESPYLLFLANGVPITSWASGNLGGFWGGLPVAAIARIEVIRGPGSALFGADAVGGVVNIVTKTAADIDGFEIGVRGGSLETGEAWWLYGGEHGGFEVALAVQGWTRGSHRGNVETDAQTALDQIFGTTASRAPGPVSTGGDGIEANLDLAKGTWRLRLNYQGRFDYGSGGGFIQALDPVGSNDRRRQLADLTWRPDRQGSDWDLEVRLGYLRNRTESDVAVLPAGTFNGRAVFADGVRIFAGQSERHLEAGATATYRGSSHHQLLLGAGVRWLDLGAFDSKRNDDIFGLPLPGGFQDVSDNPDLVFGTAEERDVSYAFIQDEWRLGSDWELIAGLRWDEYSDFGDTVNPRLALVWNATEHLTAKLLYGRAFRPPSYRELYLVNNAEVVGNQDLAPEVINTVELGIVYRGSSGNRIGINLFSYRLEDLIRPAGSRPSVYTNVGERQGEGFEIEGRWTLGGFQLSGSYALQRSTEEPLGADVPHAPGQQLTLRADGRLGPHWRLGAVVNAVADRRRAVGDFRPEVDDFVTFDLVLRRERLGRDLELAVLAHNLFDEDVREPSVFVPGGLPFFIPGDLPQAGRSVLAELRFRM